MKTIGRRQAVVSDSHMVGLREGQRDLWTKVATLGQSVKRGGRKDFHILFRQDPHVTLPSLFMSDLDGTRLPQ